MNNIFKSYGSQKIFDDFSFCLEEGQLMAITGPSGSGKSTLLNMIGLIDRFPSGEYWLQNSLLNNPTEWPQIRHQYFGFIFQAFHLLSYRTVLDNVCLPLLYGSCDVSLNEMKKKALGMLALVGLEDKAAAYPNELSGGQQQRVAIARSLVTQPMVLLADEPTGSLDQETAKQIMDLIFSLQRTHQMACILVTHDLTLAKQCDVIMDLGI